jgi:hypothetical protein
MKDTGLWLMAKLVRISMNVMNYQEPVLRNVRIYLHISIVICLHTVLIKFSGLRSVLKIHSDFYAPLFSLDFYS